MKKVAAPELPGNPSSYENSHRLAFPLKRLVPYQPAQQRCMTDTVMTADQEGLQRTGIGISDRGMLSQGAQLP